MRYSVAQQKNGTPQKQLIKVINEEANESTFFYQLSLVNLVM